MLWSSCVNDVHTQTDLHVMWVVGVGMVVYVFRFVYSMYIMDINDYVRPFRMFK